MHRLLKRQLKKLALTEGEVPDLKLWQKVLSQIDASYIASDNDRYTLERSLTISSQEMQAMYERNKDSLESRLKAILNAMPDVLFLLNEDCLCIEVMSGNKRILEDKVANGKGKYASEVFSQNQAELFSSVVRQAVDDDQLVVVDYELEINNETRYFEGRVMPTKYLHDDKRTVVFNAIDITKRVKADIQDKMISTMFENSKEGMLILDKHLNVVSVNNAFCGLNGSSIDTIDETLPELFNKLFKLDQDSTILDIVQQNGYWIGEVTGRNQFGTPYPLWLTVNTVKDNYNHIINYVLMLSDVSAIKRSQEELEHVATHDALTNLPNRVLFHDRLKQAVNRSQRSESIGALFFLDLDRFKNINDNLGHQVGDDLLVQASQRLATVCRDADTLARIGGDEFTLVVEGIDNTGELSRVAEKILNIFNEPFKLGGYKLDISVSIGISVFPRDSTDYLELVKQADTAMYSAKELGRNTFQFFTQELTSNAFEYFAIEIALKKALEKDQFFLVYQPQFDVCTNELIGVEALIRWQHPDMGVITPAKFIPIAETTGLIEDIGDWIIMEACRQCNKWDLQGIAPFTVSVNVSRKQLVIINFVSRVRKILKTNNIDGHRLEFEITESAILDNKEVVAKNLNGLKDMGISLAIDDFGTGYSSLINLKQFPLSRLKIDQSFVRDLAKDVNDEAIIRATIALGKSFNLKIIAEGVEKQEQFDFLLDEGCDQVQGFLFSEPLLPNQITDLLLISTDFKVNIGSN